jgi:hypothetical protein
VSDYIRERSPGDPSRPAHPKPKWNAGQTSWPTEEELFDRWWRLGPGDEREQEFWTPKKVAQRIEYAESRIRGLCDEGKLPYFKMAGRIYVHIPSLLRVGRIAGLGVD